MKNELKQAALEYYQLGFSIIPVGSDKKPLISWKKFQGERATPQQIEAWFKQFPHMNLGMVTGAISGVVVIDIEKGGDSNYPATITSRTGGGGYHLFYKHPGISVKNSVKDLAPLTDVRGDGGYVVLPPSTHQSGNQYEWAISPKDGEFADLPMGLLNKIRLDDTPATNWKELSRTLVSKGGRNMTAAKFAGKILHDLSPDLWETIGWNGLMDWNGNYAVPSLPKKELRNVFDSIKRIELKRRAKKSEGSEDVSQVEKLVDLALENSAVTLFRDEMGSPYARIEVEEHAEIWRCDRRQFSLWLGRAYREQTGKSPSSNAVSSALDTIEGEAIFRGKEFPLYNRVAFKDGDTIWYDLADPEWRAVKITKEGYSVERDVPILFRRYAHLSEQVIPEEGGEVKDLLKYVNITSPDQQLLFMVYLVSCFIPGFPHPIPYVYGPQGSAKSTISLIARKLVDPSKLEVLSMPKSPEELTQQLSHNYFLFYDNVSYISSEISDLLCRAITGSGFSKRRLYTDEDDVIFSILANVGINGINLSAAQPDLLERSLLLELESITSSNRREGGKLISEFMAERAKILGAIFRTLTKALTIKPDIEVAHLPRMADFTLYGCAIAEALGYSREKFLEAYNRNIESQNEEALESHIVATMIVSFMEDKDAWKGTASELLQAIHNLVPMEDLQDKGLPKKASVLSRQINTLKSTLRSAGLKIYNHREVKRRVIVIEKASPLEVASSLDVESTTMTAYPDA